MGFFDKVKGRADEAKKKATELAAEHNDKIDSVVDKAADAANKATKGKYDDKIDAAADKAKDAIDGLADDK